MALRYVSRSVGVPALGRASGPLAPLSSRSLQLGRRLGFLIVASRKIEDHVVQELFTKKGNNAGMYGEKEVEEMLATIKALSSEAPKEDVKHHE